MGGSSGGGGETRFFFFRLWRGAACVGEKEKSGGISIPDSYRTVKTIIKKTILPFKVKEERKKKKYKKEKKLKRLVCA